MIKPINYKNHTIHVKTLNEISIRTYYRISFRDDKDKFGKGIYVGEFDDYFVGINKAKEKINEKITNKK